MRLPQLHSCFIFNQLDFCLPIDVMVQLVAHHHSVLFIVTLMLRYSVV